MKFVQNNHQNLSWSPDLHQILTIIDPER